MVKNPLKKKNEINKSKNEENIAKVENGTINNNNTQKKNSTNYEHPESHPPSNEKRIDDTKISSIETNIISSQNDKQETKNEELLKKINEKNNIYHHNEIINDNSTLPEIEIKNNNNIDFRIKEDESYDQCKKKEHNELPNKQNNKNDNIIIFRNELITTNEQKDNKAIKGTSKIAKYKTNDELIPLVISLKDRLAKLENGLETIKADYGKRIKRLETNQLLLYRQLGLYHCSCDITCQ